MIVPMSEAGMTSYLWATGELDSFRNVKPVIGKWGRLQEWMEDINDSKEQHPHGSQLFVFTAGQSVTD